MIIGLTGGIGAGKSYVASLLTHDYGIPVYDCDAEAKRLNETSEEIRKGLQQLVGETVYDTEGHLQKQVLAQYLFESPAHAQRVNALIHPIVAKDFLQWAKGRDLAAMESAILFESGFDRLVDISIQVEAPYELCLQRACQRDGASREAIERRMRLQMSHEERRQRATYTLLNDGRDLHPQLEEILHHATQYRHRN